MPREPKKYRPIKHLRLLTMSLSRSNNTGAYGDGHRDGFSKLLTMRGPGDLIAYNVNMVNQTSSKVRAAYSSSESSPIVQVPADYHLIVLRFFLSSRNLVPIFWWDQNQDPLLPPQQGTYIVSLSYGTTVVSERLVFRTPALGGSTPPNNSRTLNEGNALFWSVFAHSAFLESLNAALQSVYSQIAALEPLAPPVVAGCRAPFLRFTPGTGLLSICAAREFSALFVGGNTMSIWMNAQLYTFFSESMQYDQAFEPGTNPLGSQLDFSLYITDRGGADAAQQCFSASFNPQWLTDADYVVNQLVEYDNVNYIALGPSLGSIPPANPGDWAVTPSGIPPDYDVAGVYAPGDKVFYQGGYWVKTAIVGTTPPPGSGDNWQWDTSLVCYCVTQDYPSVYRWIAAQRYLLQVGGSMSATLEITPNSASAGTSQGSQRDNQPFLLDFTPDYSSSADAAGTGAGNLLYAPSGEFRRIELLGKSPLTQVDLWVSVVTNAGVVLPVYLGPGGSFNCKLQFERRHA